ncbi:Uncharacterized protein QTN25_002092 [Entamoeba marina]
MKLSGLRRSDSIEDMSRMRAATKDNLRSKRRESTLNIKRVLIDNPREVVSDYQPLFDKLQNVHLNDVNAVVDILKQLKACSVDPVYRSELPIESLCKSLIRFLREGNDSIIHEVLCILANLCMEDTTITVIFNLQIVDILLELVYSTNDNISNTCLWCLANVVGSGISARDSVAQTSLLRNFDKLSTSPKTTSFFLHNLLRYTPQLPITTLSQLTPYIFNLLPHEDAFSCICILLHTESATLDHQLAQPISLLFNQAPSSINVLKLIGLVYSQDHPELVKLFLINTLNTLQTLAQVIINTKLLKTIFAQSQQTTSAMSYDTILIFLRICGNLLVCCDEYKLDSYSVLKHYCDNNITQGIIHCIFAPMNNVAMEAFQALYIVAKMASETPSIFSCIVTTNKFFDIFDVLFGILGTIEMRCLLEVLFFVLSAQNIEWVHILQEKTVFDSVESLVLVEDQKISTAAKTILRIENALDISNESFEY